MAFDPAPSSLFASLSEDGTDITLPIASVDDLTAAEADGTTGDWRTMMGRIIDHMYNYREALATADKPGKLTVTRNRFESGGSIVYRYSIDWFTDVDSNSSTAE